MGVSLSHEQAAELEALAREALGDMSHEIAATDNSHYRSGLISRRRILEQAVAALSAASESPATPAEPAVDLRRAGPADPGGRDRVWTVEVIFTEDDERTRADARMRAAQGEWHGWGRSRRNPMDPDVPAIGEELAAARALSDLAHQLIEVAAHGVEAFEGHPVRLHG